MECMLSSQFPYKYEGERYIYKLRYKLCSKEKIKLICILYINIVFSIYSSICKYLKKKLIKILVYKLLSHFSLYTLFDVNSFLYISFWNIFRFIYWTLKKGLPEASKWNLYRDGFKMFDRVYLFIFIF